MEEIGKPKLVGTFYTEQGLTAVQPFNFYTDNRPERIKDQREAGNARYSAAERRISSPNPTIRKGSPLINKLTSTKLFDVDVKIAHD